MSSTKHTSFHVRNITFCAVAAALLAICSWLSVKIPALEVVFTLQTFGVFLILGTLGGKLGSMAILVYLLLGAVGLPVFAGFSGGVSALLGVTGGYIWGFYVAGLLYWLITSVLNNTAWSRALGMIVGMLSCYACGTVWFMVAYTGSSALTFAAVLSQCVLPFLLWDGLKLTLAYTLSLRLRKLVQPMLLKA